MGHSESPLDTSDLLIVIVYEGEARCEISICTWWRQSDRDFALIAILVISLREWK